MTRFREGHGLAVATALAVGLSSSVSAAQTASDKAGAEALFQQGQALVSQRKFDEACPKFELSQKLDAGVGTLLYLADCYEQAGRVASAWATFKEAASAAHAAGQNEREEVARSLAAALDPKLSLLTINLASGTAPSGLEVRRDGEAVAPGLWGVPVPVDPGAHHIEARAPGKKPWSLDFPINAPGSSEVTVPPLADDPSALASPALSSPGTMAPQGSPVPAERDSGSSAQRTIGWVIAGAGVVGLGIGAGFAIGAKSKDTEADGQCGADGFCTEAGVRLGEKARSSANIATYASIGGLAAVAGGVILILTAPSSGHATSARAPRLLADVGPRGAFVGVGSAW